MHKSCSRHTHTHTQTHYYNLPARLYSNFNSSFIFIQGTLLGFDLILNKQKTLFKFYPM